MITNIYQHFNILYQNSIIFFWAKWIKMGYPHKLYMGRFRWAFLIHLITFRGISTTVVTISLSWTHRSGLFFCIQMRHGFIIQKKGSFFLSSVCSRMFRNISKQSRPGSMSPGSLPSYTGNISMFILKACKKHKVNRLVGQKNSAAML